MTRTDLVLGVAVACSVGAFATSALAEEDAHRVRHVPPTIIEGSHTSLAFEVADLDRLGRIVVLVREPRRRQPTLVRVERTETGWVAILPPQLVRAPWIEYWVEERLDGDRRRPVFASAAAPHRVQVIEREDERREADALAVRGGRESLIVLRGEWVDFGRRRVRALPQRFADRYYRVEASYGYAFFAFVEQIRIGVGTVRGESVDVDALVAPPGVPPPEGTDTDVGVDYGVGEITWYLHELLRVRTSALFGFSQDGFEVGGGADLVIGRDQGTTLTLGGELVGRLGMTGKLRLEWWTVPRFPMGAQVEVTTFPSGSDPGVRLLYDVAWAMYPGALLRLRGGYQARTSITGGPAIAAEVQLAF